MGQSSFEFDYGFRFLMIVKFTWPMFMEEWQKKQTGQTPICCSLSQKTAFLSSCLSFKGRVFAYSCVKASE